MKYAIRRTDTNRYYGGPAQWWVDLIDEAWYFDTITLIAHTCARYHELHTQANWLAVDEVEEVRQPTYRVVRKGI